MKILFAQIWSPYEKGDISELGKNLFVFQKDTQQR